MRERLSRARRAGAGLAPVAVRWPTSPSSRRVGGRVIAKATTGGYDGRGVWVLDRPGAGAAAAGPGRRPDRRGAGAAAPGAGRGGGPLAVRARSPPTRWWRPCSATASASRCSRPAPGLDRRTWPCAAQELAIRIATELDVVGVLAVELFETPTATLLVNELAMRPHNSGHWTIEGARTSQFEQHLRAVLDYPLGETTLTAPAVVMANVLGGPDRRAWASTSGCTTCSPPTPARRCTSTASRSGPAARSAT